MVGVAGRGGVAGVRDAEVFRKVGVVVGGVVGGGVVVGGGGPAADERDGVVHGDCLDLAVVRRRVAAEGRGGRPRG